MKPVYLIVGETEVEIPQNVKDHHTIVRVEDGTSGVGWARAFRNPSVVHLCAPSRSTLDAWLYPSNGSDISIGNPDFIISVTSVEDQLKVAALGYDFHHTSTPLSPHLRRYS
jgi:hypothetical protein